MRLRPGLLFGVVLLVCAAVTVHSQSPQSTQPIPIFRSRVDVVVLDVSVLDKDRRPVRGLSAEDFRVIEDGKPQKITMFSAVDLPDPVEPTAPWIKQLAPDVRRNEDDANAQLVVLLLDDANAIEAGDVLSAKRYARSVIERLGPADLCAVVFVADARSGQEFTNDRTRLLAAVDRYNAPDALSNGALKLMGGRMVLDTLKGQAEALVGLPAMRKTAIVLTAKGANFGDSYARQRLGEPQGEEPPDFTGMNVETLGAFGQYLRAAQRANLTVYCVDPGGLRAPGMNGRGEFVPNPMPLATAIGLQALSVSTGGFAVMHTNDPEPGISQAFSENRAYYLIAYASSNPRADGRYRKVDVKVNRPGVVVRSRSGYFEPEAPKRKKTAPPPPLAAAVADPVAKDDVPMQVTAAPFAVPGARTNAVAVALGLRQQVPAGVARFVNFDVEVSAYDYLAKRRGFDRFRARATLRPGPAEETSFEVLSRLELPPGRYQLRIAAQQRMPWTTVAPGETPRGIAGSVFCDLDIPDFAREPLSMSGVVIGVSPPVSHAIRERFTTMIPVAPTTLRQFIGADAVTAFLRVYQGTKAALLPATVHATIVDASGWTAFEKTEDLGERSFSAGRAADYMLQLPTRDLTPGEYLLTLEAKAGRYSARRAVRFTMR